MSGLEVGSRAPQFSAPTQDGQLLTLDDCLQRGALVLFFYPKDGTPICTAEACAFRDAYEEFLQCGASVVGVSGDSVAAHQAFATKHRLPFPLIADTQGELRKSFGVARLWGLLPGRVTYVIDHEGIIRKIFSGALHSSRHVREALDALRSTPAEGGEERSPSRSG